MAVTYFHRLQEFSLDVWLALLAWAFTFGTSFGILAVLFNLYLLRLGFGIEQIGLIQATAWLAFAGGGALAGIVGRRHSPRSIMIAGVSLCLSGWLIAFQAELAPQGWRALWVVLMAR